MKKIIKWIGIFLILYIIYFAVAGSLHTKTEQDKVIENSNYNDIDLSKYYSDDIGVDKAGMIIDRDEGLSLRLNLLDKAKETVDINYYQIDNDISGDIFLGKILETADRGVKIRLIISGVSNHWSGENSYRKVALSSNENIKFKFYGKKDLIKPWNSNNVNHDKIIIVDNNYFLTSGRNITDRFFIGNGDKIVNDMDLVIKLDNPKDIDKSVISQSKKYFEETFNSKHSYTGIENIDEYFQPRIDSSRRQLMDKYEEAIKQENYLEGRDILDNINFYEINKANLLYNSVDDVVKEPYIWMTISKFINNAKKDVTIQTPYYALSDNMKGFLDIDHLEKINYEVITNSLGSSPNLPAFSAYIHNKTNYLGYTTVYEYQSPGSIHGKAVSIDNNISMIGSSNVDPRSAMLSTENMVVINGEEFNQELQNNMEKLKEHSLKAINKEDYSVDEGEEIKKPSFAKNLMFKVFSPVSNFFIFLV